MTNKEFRDLYKKENYDVVSYPFGAEEMLLIQEFEEMEREKIIKKETELEH